MQEVFNKAQVCSDNPYDFMHSSFFFYPFATWIDARTNSCGLCVNQVVNALIYPWKGERMRKYWEDSSPFMYHSTETSWIMNHRYVPFHKTDNQSIKQNIPRERHSSYIIIGPTTTSICNYSRNTRYLLLEIFHDLWHHCLIMQCYTS